VGHGLAYIVLIVVFDGTVARGRKVEPEPMTEQKCHRCGNPVEPDFYCISCGLVPPQSDKQPANDEALAKAA
jgi:hypothetical protein